MLRRWVGCPPEREVPLGGPSHLVAALRRPLYTRWSPLLRRRGGPGSPAVASEDQPPVGEPAYHRINDAERDQPGAGHLFQRAGAVQQRQPSPDILHRLP